MSLRTLGRLTVAIIFWFGGDGIAQTIRVTGKVTDSLTSSGIGGAKVQLLEFPSVSAMTVANGAFTLAATNGIRRPFPAYPSISESSRGGRSLLYKSVGYAHPLLDFYSMVGSRIPHLAPSSHSYLFLRQSQTAEWNAEAKGRPQSIEMPLAKASASYTLQVSANGYLTKYMSLPSLDTALGTIPLVQASEPVGVWTQVTPEGMGNDPSGFGAGSIAADPLRPSDLYVGGSESGIWKSTDYGKTWTRIHDLSPDVTRGSVLAVAPTTPATLYVAGFGRIFKSTDAGKTFDTLSTDGFDPYSLTVDPYDPNHLLSGLHEEPDVIESTNGGITWKKVGSGSIGGGVSVYPFFIDMGNAAATRVTWLAIAQNGSSPGRTTNGGASWSMPAGLSGLQHPHGNARIHQQGPNLWVGGAYDFRGTIMRSTDYGVTWSKVTTNEKPEALVWGTDKKVYAMYAWACSKCDVEPNFAHAPLPGGDNWTYEETPNLKIGPNTMAVTHNGSHHVFVGLMWAEGLWRYVEP